MMGFYFNTLKTMAQNMCRNTTDVYSEAMEKSISERRGSIMNFENYNVYNGVNHPVILYSDRDNSLYKLRHSVDLHLKNSSSIQPLVTFEMQRPLNVIYGYSSVLNFYNVSVKAPENIIRVEIPDNYQQYDMIIVSWEYANAAWRTLYGNWDYLDRLYVVGAKVFSDEKTPQGRNRLIGNCEIEKAYSVIYNVMDGFCFYDNMINSYCNPSLISMKLFMNNCINYKQYYMSMNIDVDGWLAKLSSYIEQQEAERISSIDNSYYSQTYIADV